MHVRSGPTIAEWIVRYDDGRAARINRIAPYGAGVGGINVHHSVHGTLRHAEAGLVAI